MVKGNQKGNAFEREMCRTFSLWFSKGETDDYFWRTSGSGSRATNRRMRGKDLTKFQHGDMRHDRPEGMPLVNIFSFEFKSYAGIDFQGIFHTISPENSLLSFWAKCVRDAEESDRVPWLVTKVIHGNPVAWVPRSLLEIFVELGYCVDASRGCQFWVPPMEVVTKRTYARKKRGEKKAKSGKGKPKLEKYTFVEPQHVVGISLDKVLESIDEPVHALQKLEHELARLPIPRRKDPTNGRQRVLQAHRRGRKVRVARGA